MALNNNMINISPAYMCPHSNCPYYPYPIINGDVRRKEVSSQTDPSSSEDGIGIREDEVVAVHLRSSEVTSPLTSPSSSSFASPPQSLSPEHNNLTAIPASFSLPVTTSTTTSIVVSRSDLKLQSQNHHHTSKSCSQSSSQATTVLASSTYPNNNKHCTTTPSTVVAKISKPNHGQPTHLEKAANAVTESPLANSCNCYLSCDKVCTEVTVNSGADLGPTKEFEVKDVSCTSFSPKKSAFQNRNSKVSITNSQSKSGCHQDVSDRKTNKNDQNQGMLSNGISGKEANEVRLNIIHS